MMPYASPTGTARITPHEQLGGNSVIHHIGVCSKCYRHSPQTTDFETKETILCDSVVAGHWSARKEMCSAKTLSLGMHSCPKQCCCIPQAHVRLAT
jgi:hypothetical protein